MNQKVLKLFSTTYGDSLVFVAFETNPLVSIGINWYQELNIPNCMRRSKVHTPISLETLTYLLLFDKWGFLFLDGV
jgi:hypothetical protein